MAKIIEHAKLFKERNHDSNDQHDDLFFAYFIKKTHRNACFSATSALLFPYLIHLKKLLF